MAAPVKHARGGRAPGRLARLRRQRRRAPERLRRLRPARASGRPRARAGDEGEARVRRGARDRGARAVAAARRGAVRALPGLRRLPLPGSRLRGAGGGEGRPGARRAQADRRDRGAAARSDPRRRVAVLLPQQARVLVHADAVRPGARLPQGGPLGRGARDREVLAHDRPRQRDPERRPRLGARGRARRLRPGRAHRLPPPPRRPRGPEHRAGARDARDRAGREVRARLLRRGADAASPRSSRSTGP